MRAGLLPEAFDRNLLPDKPPALEGSPVEYTVPSGAAFAGGQAMTGELAGRDLVINMPASTRTRGMIGWTGEPRNVYCVGGAISLTTLTESLLRGVGATGTIYLEGLELLGGGSLNDVLNLGGTSGSGPWPHRPKVIIQNCILGGVTGEETSEKEGKVFHSDTCQMTGGVSQVKLSRVTMEGGYQCLIAKGTAGLPYGSLILSEVNTRYYKSGTAEEQHNGFHLFLYSMLAEKMPVSFNDVYCDPGLSGRKLRELIWAARSEAEPTELEGGKKIEFPSSTEVTGIPRLGPPPAGDFCTSAGLGYASPGHL